MPEPDSKPMNVHNKIVIIYFCFVPTHIDRKVHNRIEKYKFSEMNARNPFEKYARMNFVCINSTFPFSFSLSLNQ